MFHKFYSGSSTLICGTTVFAHVGGHSGGVSAAPSVLFSIGKFQVTNSIIMSWIVSLVMILLIKFLLRNGPSIIPSTRQAIFETIISGFGGMIKPIVGNKAFKSVFSFLLAYFFFVLFQNISGLLPGVGSIGFYVDGKFYPILRPGNADLNTTLSLAIVSFVAWFYFCIKYVGIKSLIMEIFGNKSDRSEFSSVIYCFLCFLFFAMGFIECISILCRVVSLSFRLFGNTFGGENLLHNMCGFSSILKTVPIVNYLSYIIPLPFYLLEFLIAIMQAFVFTLLVSVYIGLVCNHEDHDTILTKENYVECNS